MRTLLIFFLLPGFAFATPAVKQLSEKPRVYYIEKFLTNEECEEIIRLATPELERSRVIGVDEYHNEIHEARTSDGMFFNSGTPKVVQAVEARIAEITHHPLANCEDLQVLRYREGGKFSPHYDYFDPEVKECAVHLNRGGQRCVTVILYLNNTPKGGETIFPKANLAVKPKKGDAVFFYSTHPDGSIDQDSLHGGEPVIEGEKWVAVKWIREGQFK